MTYLFSKNKGKYLDAYLKEDLEAKEISTQRNWCRI